MFYAIKTVVSDLTRETLIFRAQKTMYGGKQIAKGDTVFIFATGTSDGSGLRSKGVVTESTPVPRKPGIARQPPRVSIGVKPTAMATRRLGREELKRYSDWTDGKPETELNFKFYRQATDKIVGISDETAAFLDRFFEPHDRPRPPRSGRATGPR